MIVRTFYVTKINGKHSVCAENIATGINSIVAEFDDRDDAKACAKALNETLAVHLDAARELTVPAPKGKR